MESDDLIVVVIPGRVSVNPGSPYVLTTTGRGLIAAPMINAANILVARRRRAIAVWADICV